jgi:DNA polymerase III alpha subunit (gram-positive type)
LSIDAQKYLEELKLKLNNLVVIDVEASGFGVSSFPIEVAIAHIDGRFSDSFLINPETAKGWHHWDKEAEKIHGIQRLTLVKEGISVHEAAERLNSWLSEHHVVSDNARFDQEWLDELFREANNVAYFTVDSLQEDAGSELVQSMQNIQKIKKRKHRALDDVLQIIDEMKLALTQLEQSNHLSESGDHHEH